MPTLIKQAKKEYFKQAIRSSNNDSGKVWKHLKQLIPSKSKTCAISSIRTNGGDISEPEIIADVLNYYFASIGPKLAKQISVCTESSSNDLGNATVSNGYFHLEPVGEDFVLKHLQGLVSTKATGHDSCPARLIKIAAPVIAGPLTYLINLSLNTGVFPQSWKKARVTPIHKGGDIKEPSNFRPISVLPIFSKILERAVFEQLYNYMNSNQLLNTNQSGFRPLHSTSTALINITDDWLSSFDHGELVGVVMLDLNKAFDTVDLDILIQKLKHYGVDDKGINWFNSYLKGRSHFTTINGKNSSFRPVCCGIPQGSIIGPLMFIIYINDLPLHVSHCKVSMYADDTALYYPSKNESDLIEKINEDYDRCQGMAQTK